MALALIVANGIVISRIVVDPDHPVEIEGLVLAPDGVDPGIGWTYSGGVFAPPPPATPTKAALEAFTASRRYAIETGGIAVEGVEVATDRESQSLIAGADAYLQAGGAEPITFKGKTGWVSLGASEMHAIALAVAGHVQSCFAAEKVVAEDIEAGSVTTMEEIAAHAAWPTNPGG